MTVASWPAELPKPRRDGYGQQINDPRIAKNVETGPIGWRRRWSSVTRSMPLTLHADRAEKGLFDRFYRDTCAFGSLPFWMPDPVSDNWPLLDGAGVPLLLDDGTPLLMAAQLLCLWGQSAPSERFVGLRFEISFQVVVMP
nr:hypothetical protein [uncultured Cohaesibacter sp.]